MTSLDDRAGDPEADSVDPVVLLDWTPWDSRELAGSLADRYRVLSLDPPTETSDTDAAAVVAAGAAEAAGLDVYTVVGVSLGADAALRLALLRPSSVSTLVLVSPTCVAPSAAKKWDTPALAASVMLAHPPGLDCANAAAESPRPDPARTALLSSLAEQWRADGVDASRRLAELACATLVVFGQEDRLGVA